MESRQFVIERALATRSAQDIIKLVYLWPYKTMAQWDSSIATFNSQETVVQDAQTVVDSMLGTVNLMMEALHDTTVKVLGLLRTVAELAHPDNGHLVSMLSASGHSRADILVQAEELASAWKRINESWVPVTGLTLESFELQITDCEAALGEYMNSRTVWRSELGKWNVLTKALNRDCMAWYNDVTHVFPVGTPEGDMIRIMVPTTTELTPLPEEAQLTLQDVQPGEVTFTLYAEHASKFDVYQRSIGETEWEKVGVDVLPGLYVREGLAAGDYEFKAAGMNSRGTGPFSSDVSVTVPLLQAAA